MVGACVIITQVKEQRTPKRLRRLNVLPARSMVVGNGWHLQVNSLLARLRLMSFSELHLKRESENKSASSLLFIRKRGLSVISQKVLQNKKGGP